MKVTVQTRPLLICECHIGFHGSVSELCFPNARRESDDILRGMLIYTLQYVDQISIDIDAVQLTCRDQALNDADLFGAKFGPAEQPAMSLMQSSP